MEIKRALIDARRPVFDAGKMGVPNQAMVLTLPDGGSGVVGSVSVGTHFTLPNQYVQGGVDFSNNANDYYLAAV